MALEVASLYATLGLDTKDFERDAKKAKKSFGDLANEALSFAAGGLIEKGISGIGGALIGGVKAGFEFNNTLETVTAQLNAFTKDGGKTAEILDMIRERAAKTPFEFDEMAKSAAALLPVAKQTGTSLEDLVAQAEILAASNPAQGLEGAAFSLKEALGGDFVSIVERFNLPRQRLKELKDEGVPAMEAISIAMREMGLDASLVANLSETASGRMSTLSDTLTNLSATVTRPFFEKFSASLGELNGFLAENEPLLTGMAETVAGKLAQGLEATVGFLGELFTKAGEKGTLDPLIETFTRLFDVTDRLGEATGRLGESLGIANTELDGIDILLGTFNTLIIAATAPLEGLTYIIDGIAGAFEGWGMTISAVSQALKGDFSGALQTLDDALPEWLRPGSPTPFELGLRGISSAIGSIPPLELAGSMTMAPVAPMTSQTTNLNIGSQSFGPFSGPDGVNQALVNLVNVLRGELNQ